MPFMFASVLSLLWGLCPEGVLSVQARVAVQIVGYNKIHMGLSVDKDNRFSKKVEKKLLVSMGSSSKMKVVGSS